MGRIFHVATQGDWQAGLRAGQYTTSTRGRTLAEEGFIHASRADQWQQVRERHFADVTEPLVLLVIDTDRLEAPVIAESVSDSEETFPHVYGPLNLNAVVQAVPLAADRPDVSGGDTFGSVFLEEVFRNAALGLLLLVLAVIGVLAGGQVDPDWGPWAGLVAGLGCGFGTILVANARRRRQPGPDTP